MNISLNVDSLMSRINHISLFKELVYTSLSEL